MSDRDKFIHALRVTATMLETVPDLPPPSVSAHTLDLHWFVTSSCPDPGAELARLARFMPCKLTKNQPGAGRQFDDTYYELTGEIDGVKVRITGLREEVCTKVVTGAEVVIDLVPDPSAPLIEVPRTVETYEWRCDPLLAKTPAQAAVPDSSPEAAGVPPTAAPGEPSAVSQ